MQYFGVTETGPVRKSNQDDFFAAELTGGAFICAVCDGMGGAAAGNIASSTACSTIKSELESKLSALPCDSFDFYGSLRSSLGNANLNICDKVKENPDYSGMGTTAVVLISYGEKAYIANIGDSRCYCFSQNKLERITKDHSFVQMLVDSGSITEEEAKSHPKKNIITRSLGDTSDTEADLFSCSLNGNVFLLCSDGLTNYVSEERISAALEAMTDAESCARALVNEAVNNGGGDNVTVLIIDFSK